MKPLEFTSEQKDKLLEMCQVLFPDYNIFEIDEDGYILLILEKCPAIHWFEFCTKELISALAWKNVTSDLVGDLQFAEFYNIALQNIFLDNMHPVDYLYKEYLKLNKDENSTSNTKRLL